MELIQAIIRRKLLFNQNNSILGHKAEKIFRESSLIKCRLEKYFGRSIHTIEKVHGKKTDNLILFDDNSFVSIQNKKIKEIGGRGLSVDRRSLDKCFSQDINLLLGKLCLEKNISQNEKYLLKRKLENQDLKPFLEKIFTGNILKPQHFIFMQSHNLINYQLYSLETQKLMEYLNNNIQIDVKNTCLYLGQNIYLQRKGGKKKDKKYQDIQTKFIITKDILDISQKI